MKRTQATWRFWEPFEESFLVKNLSFEAIGYKILLEILVKTKGAKVKEVPFVCVNRQEGSSKFSFSIINDYFKLLKILRKAESYNTKKR